MRGSLYVCPECLATSDHAGDCPYCGNALEPVESGLCDPHDEEDDEC
jgi:hypothetical protein